MAVGHQGGDGPQDCEFARDTAGGGSACMAPPAQRQSTHNRPTGRLCVAGLIHQRGAPSAQKEMVAMVVGRQRTRPRQSEQRQGTPGLHVMAPPDLQWQEGGRLVVQVRQHGHFERTCHAALSGGADIGERPSAQGIR